MAAVRLPIPRLVVEIFDNGVNFGPGLRKCIVHDAAKVGWSWWSRFPGTCYFSLSQTSRYNELIVPGLSHIRIWYMNEATGYGPVLVFAGRINDADEAAADVVWRGHAYIAELALSRTGYRVMYSGKKISKAVTQEWQRNGTRKFANYGAREQLSGLLQHVTTGTIESPTKNAKAIRLEQDFGVIDVPRLLFFFDLTEIARANTNNNVTFEITRAHAPAFNFWSNRGTAITTRILTHPGIIRDFRYVVGVKGIRNDLASIGTRRGQAREIKAEQTTGTYGTGSFGRRQDTFPIRTLAGMRNLDDEAGRFSAQKLVVKRAVKEATRPTRALRLDIPPSREEEPILEPFDGWDIEDTIPVEIERGRTSIDRTYRFAGITGIQDGQGYHQSVYVTTETA